MQKVKRKASYQKEKNVSKRCSETAGKAAE